VVGLKELSKVAVRRKKLKGVEADLNVQRAVDASGQKCEGRDNYESLSIYIYMIHNDVVS
jgi:hypothetical protein